MRPAWSAGAIPALGTAPDQRVLAVLAFQLASVDRGRERGVVEDPPRGGSDPPDWSSSAPPTDHLRAARGCESSALRRLGAYSGLQATQIVRGALRLGGGGEDRALVLFEDGKPTRQIRGVVIPDLGGDAKLGT
jgi:hypothetical protein